MQPILNGYRRSWLLPLALPVLLAGCNSLTYGTGTNTSLQTFQDLTSIVNIGGSSRREEIAYAPRAGLVIPPTMDLPPAGNPSAQAANFPVNQSTGDRPGPLGMGMLRGQAPSTGLVASSDIFFSPTGSVDAAGNPIRVSIVEPPARYRVPDTTAPLSSQGAADVRRASGWSRFWRSLWPF
ncbi:MAG: hypothetical protein IT535_07255 [Bauldia sp.]|nr:hypothetical protein [Bauldia sp.]